MKFRDIVQEAVIKTIPKKKSKKAKWLSEENLQIAMKRREVKAKGEKEGKINTKQDASRMEGSLPDFCSFLSDS